MLNRVRLRARSIFMRRRLEREMQEEMAEHLERATARFVARGLPAEEARHAARREFGNVASLQEDARDARGGRRLGALVADARFALRHFQRTPGTTIAIIAVLAVGMSMSTALFSFLHSYTVQPPPGIPRADDLVRIRGSETSREGMEGRTFSRDELQEYEGLEGRFRAVTGWTNDAVIIDARGEMARQALPATAMFVTGDYFGVLGVRPMLGAGLPITGSADGTATPVAVISHSIWDQAFGRSPSVIGATLMVDGIAVTVVGVAPPRFKGVNLFTEYKLWLPLASRSQVLRDAARRKAQFGAAARLFPGVDLRAASSAAGVVAAHAAASQEEATMRPLDGRVTTDVVPLLVANGDPNFEQDVQLMSIAFTVLGILFLLVTCTNVSALLAGLGMARRREIAIRLSMGAARSRIIRQLLTESVLLAVVAGPVALGVVVIVHHAVVGFLPEIPITIKVSWSAAAFTFGVALAVGVVFGLSPALHATRMSVASALKGSSSRSRVSHGRLQRGLVVSQIAFTQPLIVAVAALLLAVAGEYRRQGFNEYASQVIALRLRANVPASVAQSENSATISAQRRSAMLRLGERLRAAPGVAAVVEAPQSTAELHAYSVLQPDRVEAGARGPLKLEASVVAPGYFATMGIPLVLGREFAPTDVSFSRGHTVSAIPVVIGNHLARRLWPGANPIGQRLQPPADSLGTEPVFSVVGVIDEPGDDDTATNEHRVYLPMDSNSAGSSLALLIRTTSNAESLIPSLRAIVHGTAPDMIVSDIRTVAQIEARLHRDFQRVAAVLAGGGFLALFLAAIGLYAVVSFAVGQRKGEIAVRMAVGAQARQIIGWVVGDGLRLTGLGLLAGLPLSIAALRMLQSRADVLPSVPLLPVTGAAVLGVLAVSVAAMWIPTRSAAAVDPASILRRE